VRQDAEQQRCQQRQAEREARTDPSMPIASLRGSRRRVQCQKGPDEPPGEQQPANRAESTEDKLSTSSCRSSRARRRRAPRGSQARPAFLPRANILLATFARRWQHEPDRASRRNNVACAIPRQILLQRHHRNRFASSFPVSGLQLLGDTFSCPAHAQANPSIRDDVEIVAVRPESSRSSSFGNQHRRPPCNRIRGHDATTRRAQPSICR